MALGEFHHFGVPTKAESAGETFLEGAKVYITDPGAHPFKVEFLRFMDDSPMPEILKKWPHAAFLVPDLDAALAGKNVLIAPFDATDELRCAFIQDGDALIEVMVRRK
jgi:hypothetical protein